MIADRRTWQSRPLSFKWQDWIALGGRIIVHRECRQWQHNVALSDQHSIATSAGTGLPEEAGQWEQGIASSARPSARGYHE
jgi:hypothetical protein